MYCVSLCLMMMCFFRSFFLVIFHKATGFYIMHKCDTFFFAFFFCVERFALSLFFLFVYCIRFFNSECCVIQCKLLFVLSLSLAVYLF